MNKSLSSIIKSTLAITTLALASTSANAAPPGLKVNVNGSAAWDMNMNHIMAAGGSISASNQNVGGAKTYTSNTELDNAAWGHFGSWYSFMTHDTATTTISVTAIDTAIMSPGFTVWRTDGEFDGGPEGSTGEESSRGIGTPHSFNQVGAAGSYGTYWMTDDSVATDGLLPTIIHGASANGILETMGYANDGSAQSINGWGYEVNSDGVQDGHAELTLADMAAGWYVIFIGGADASLTGGNVDLNISSVSAVPVPAAVYLFGTALAGLFGASRRKLTAVQA